MEAGGTGVEGMKECVEMGGWLEEAVMLFNMGEMIGECAMVVAGFLAQRRESTSGGYFDSCKGTSGRHSICMGRSGTAVFRNAKYHLYAGT